MKKKSFYSSKFDYEKEIYSQVIPISKRELEVIIRGFCGLPTELSVNIPGYYLEYDAENILVFHVTDRSNFGKLNIDDNDNFIDEDLLFIPPEKEPYVLGYVEYKEVMEHIKIPIQIRIFSYHPEMDLWWGRLAVVIKNKVDNKMPGFFSTTDPDNPSQSSIIEDKQRTDNNRVHKGSVVRGKWKKVWHHIRGWREVGMSYDEISKKLENDPAYKNLPHNRNTLAQIEKAANAGELEDKKV